MPCLSSCKAEAYHAVTRSGPSRILMSCRAGAICTSSLPRREALTAALLAQPFMSLAAGAKFSFNPFQREEAESQAIYYPRRALNQAFAVLLLRSVYDAADALNAFAMNEHQKLFWKLRQREYEPYLQKLKPLPVRQGDLTDPLYFDFISFAEFATLAEEIRSGKQVFQEYCEECENSERTIVRPTGLEDNRLLPAALCQGAGDRIYAGLRHGFRGETFNAPGPCGPDASLEELTGCVQSLLDVLVRNGFAAQASVSDVVPHRGEHAIHWHGAGACGGTFSVQLDRPANLWGLGRLGATSQQEAVAPAYDALIIAAYLRASGCSPEYHLQRISTGVTEQWTVCA